MQRTCLWLLAITAVATAQHHYQPYGYNDVQYIYQGSNNIHERSLEGDQSASETIHVDENPDILSAEKSNDGIVPDDVLITFDQEPSFFADLLTPPMLTVNETNPVNVDSTRANATTTNETEDTAHERSKRQILSPQFSQQAGFVNPNLLQQQFDFSQQLPAGFQLGQFQLQDPAQLQLQQHLLQNQQFFQQPILQDQLLQQAQAANRFGSLPLTQQQTANLGQQAAFRASPATGTSAPLNSFQTGAAFSQNLQDGRFGNAIPQTQQDFIGGIPIVQNTIPLTQNSIPVSQLNVPVFQNSFAAQNPQSSNILRNQNLPLSQGFVQNQNQQAAAAQLFQQGDTESQFAGSFARNPTAQLLSNNAQFVQSAPQQQGFFGQVNPQTFPAATGIATGEVPRFGFQAANSASFPAIQQQQQQQQQQRQQTFPQFAGQFTGQQFNSGFNAQVQQQVPKQQQQQNGSSVESNSASVAANRTKAAEQATSTESVKVIRDSNAQQASGVFSDNLRPSASGNVPLGAGQTGQPFAPRGPAPAQFGANAAKADSASAQSVNDPLQRQQQQQFQTKQGSFPQGFGGFGASSQGFGQLPPSFVFVPNVGQPGKAGQDQPQFERVKRSAGDYQSSGGKKSLHYGKPIKGDIYPINSANNQMFTFIGGLK